MRPRETSHSEENNNNAGKSKLVKHLKAWWEKASPEGRPIPEGRAFSKNQPGDPVLNLALMALFKKMVEGYTELFLKAHGIQNETGGIISALNHTLINLQHKSMYDKYTKFNTIDSLCLAIINLVNAELDRDQRWKNYPNVQALCKNNEDALRSELMKAFMFQINALGYQLNRERFNFEENNQIQKDFLKFSKQQVQTTYPIFDNWKVYLEFCQMPHIKELIEKDEPIQKLWENYIKFLDLAKEHTDNDTVHLRDEDWEKQLMFSHLVEDYAHYDTAHARGTVGSNERDTDEEEPSGMSKPKQ